jgi:hypothetical protein
MSTAANQNLELDGLTIRVEHKDDAIFVGWDGRSEMQDPESVMGPFFRQLLPVFKGKKLTMDFQSCTYINSTTLQPLLALIKELDENSVDTELIYDGTTEWQRITFRCIKVITRTLPHITLRSA